MADPECAALGIPEHLHRSERPLVPDFQPDELLYRRGYSKQATDWITDSISTNRMSVDRSSLCQAPEDVLWDGDGKQHLGDGIFSFVVGEILGIEVVHPTPDIGKFKVAPIHKPLQCHYPHSELTVYLNDEQADVKKKPAIKSLIRDELRKITHAPNRLPV